MVWDVSGSKAHVCCDPACAAQAHRARVDAGRRRFLTALAASGATALLPGGAPLAQAPTPQRKLIDVHHHFYPPAFKQASQEYQAARGGRLLPFIANWTPAVTLEEMDKNGVATAILSIASVPGTWFGLDPAGMRRLSRQCNDYAAQMMRDYPGRFGIFASLPMTDIEGTLTEIEYVFDTLKADGVSLPTSFGDKWPGEPAYNPVWEELNRRKAIVYFHPVNPDCCGNLVKNVPASMLEYPYDTARTALSLLFNGTLAKFPDIRWLLSQNGGALPMFAGRIVALAKLRPSTESTPNGIDYELKRLHYETANSTDPAPMAALLAYVPLRQIMFGTDFPYVTVGQNAEGLEKIGLSADELAAIQRGNAMQLIPRLKA